MRDDLERRLLDLGATDGDIARAEAEGWLALLALDRLLVPGAATHDLRQLAQDAEIEPDFVKRLWRAVGFPDVPDDLPLFTGRDVDAARALLRQSTPEEVADGRLLQQVRVVSALLARVASVEAETFAARVRTLESTGLSDADIAFGLFGDPRMADLAMLIDYLHRIQLRAAVWRLFAISAAPDIAIAVGFADLSGYTKLAASVDAATLSDLVGRWEAVAFDTLAQHGARVVKTIGDEVMFVALPDAAVAAAVALRRASVEAELPDLRIGIAAGDVITRDGDYFGPVVNLASRLSEVARPGEVLVPAALVPDLGVDVAGLGVRTVPLGLHSLRGIGFVEVVGIEDEEDA